MSTDDAAFRTLMSRIGDIAGRIGMGRTRARLYALLLMSERALSLDDMAGMLGVSKASVSTEVRALAEIGAVRQVWTPESRRDLYEAEGDLMKVLKIWARGGIARRIEETGGILEEAERYVAALEARNGAASASVRSRLEAAKSLHGKLSGVVALIPMLLGDGDATKKGTSE